MAAFQDRADAGRQLAARLKTAHGHDDRLILALPRGGVPVAYEVAVELDAPLDVFLVRKLGVPAQPELAMGAIATGGVRALNDEVIRALQIPAQVIDDVTAEQRRELQRREHAYRDDRPAPVLRGRSIVLIDDGLATGSTMRAAIQAVRQQEAARIAVAVPVAAAQTCAEFEMETDDFFCLLSPDPFYSVGTWYDDFSQTTDEEVRALLQRAGVREVQH